MNGERKYWLDDPRNVRKLFLILCVVCAGVFVGDAFYHKHAAFDAEHIFGFYAIFGFLAYVGLIFAAKGLRKLIMRKEDYYD
jgi:hypothetical protein